ncbi:MAG: carbohydrate-binding protein [Actinobacteria bacterium 13_1_20CM_3_71_11]|nr:MAG: carbohydrate-binding protein [Actinobacteria bacterium 13_1_20CM_3_71_11]
MRRILLSGLAAGGLVLGTLGAVLPSASAATNLVSNPGFETGTLAGWTCDPSDKAVTGHAHSGTWALEGAAGNDTAQCAQTLTLVPNTAYRLSADVQGSYVFLGVSGAVSAQTWTSSTGYAPLSLSFTTTSATSVTVYVHGWYGQGTYHADDVVLDGPGGGPTPSPTRSPSKSPSPSPSPSKSPSPSPSGSTPPPPPSGGFRNPIYVMPLDNHPQNITDAINASGDRDFNLAFVLDSGGCTPAWDGDPALKVSADSTVTGVVSAVRAKGGEVSVSFGGYNGTELGATCGSSSSLAAAYQSVINKYKLTRIDLDYEGDDLDANMGVRFGAIKILESNAAAAGRTLHVSLTVPMTTVGFPGSGIDELKQAKAAGATLDIVNIMAFDYGLTNAGDQATSVEMVAQAAQGQLKGVYGWSDATAWAHLGLQIMNGHTDQPSELFTQATFQTLLGYARSKHVGWFSYWSLNRDRACDPSVPHNWADGSCSSVAQNPYDFSKIVAQYTG